MKVGFTGTRRGLREQQAKALEVVLIGEWGPGAGELHHGDCVGADEHAHNIARSHGRRVVIHPPDSDAFRAFCEGDQSLSRLPYLQRNRAIVDCTDVLVACPDGPERQRSGTWSTVRYALRSGKHVTLVHPDGRIERRWA